MKNKYFMDNICDSRFNENNVILSNKFTGKWIKLPIECYQAIKYSSENLIPVNEVVDAFEQKSDQEYFKKVLNNLDSIGLLDEEKSKDIKMTFVPKVVFSITNRCNLKCGYCCVDASSSSENKDILSTEDLKTAINNMLKVGPQRIVLSGGEPLMRSDFFEILSYIKSVYDGKVILCTNATLIKPEDIEYIAKNIYALEISLDGFDEQSCSLVRGPGVFDKVINIVELLHKNNMQNIALSMVVGKNNANNIDDFYELNKKLGTKPSIRNFSSIGRGSYNFEDYLEEEYMVHYLGKNDYEDISSIKSDCCYAGNTQLFVNHDGNIFVCPLLQYEEFKISHVFDFNEEVIKKVFKREISALHSFDKLRPKNIPDCKECKINIFCTSCPAKMYTLRQNKKSFDYNCNYMKETLMSKIW